MSTFNLTTEEVKAAAMRGETVKNIFTFNPCPRCKQIDLNGSLHACHDLRGPSEPVKTRGNYDTTGNRIPRWHWRGGATGDVEPS